MLQIKNKSRYSFICFINARYRKIEERTSKKKKKNIYKLSDRSNKLDAFNRIIVDCI